MPFLPREDAHADYVSWAIRNWADRKSRVPTGLSSKFDIETAGLGRGEVALFGAPFGNGKTTIGVCLAFNAAYQGYRVGYVTAEESPSEIRQRILSRLTGYSSIDLYNRKLTLEQMHHLKEASRWITDELALDILGTGGQPFDEVLNDVAIELAVRPLDVIIIDNLQAFGSSDESRPIALEKAVRSFRDLCIEAETAGVMLTQVSGDGDRKPLIRDTSGKVKGIDYLSWKPRWSGDAEGPADKLVYLFSYEDLVPEDPMGQGRMDVFTKKNRTGPKKRVYQLRVDFPRYFIGSEDKYAEETKDGGLWWTRKRTAPKEEEEGGRRPEEAGDILRIQDARHSTSEGVHSDSAGGQLRAVGFGCPTPRDAEIPTDSSKDAEERETYPF